MSKPKIFLAGPFKALVDSKTQIMSDDNIQRFSRLIDFFESHQFDVHCAHKRESWGREFMTPQQCTKIDFDEISSCDYFIAFPGVPASPGTHIEIGWASALGKPIILLLEKGEDYAFLIQGLGEVGNVKHVIYEPKKLDSERVKECLESFSEDFAVSMAN